ncbi:uncharacterized protein LOC120819780 [Gasterosteus aculeatus]
MMHLAFLLLIIFTDGSSSQKVCSYQDVVEYLNLTADNSVFRMTRPVLDHKRPTVVQLDIILFALLAVIEKTQTFVPFVWVIMKWNNERISWDPAHFCGITQISIPKEMLWKPDLFIYEMTQKDESPQNPYMYVSYDGTVSSEEEMKVVSTCKMDVHKFPFDIQRCNISIGSAVHCVDEIRVFPFSNSSRATQFSREVIRTQGEWEFLQLTVTSQNFTIDNKQWEYLIYTFTMKRRPLLHVTNFLLPILFFLILDLASFFIEDRRGEKLGFKVTILLAISVLLLILNDILPSMSNKTPLIATYCVVIFALMLLSLLETILVTYFMEKDCASKKKIRLSENRENKQDTFITEEKRQSGCLSICKASDGEKQHELLPMVQEVNNSVQARESDTLLLIMEELKELQNILNLHLVCRHDGGKSGLLAARINRAFFIFYIATVSLFLTLIPHLTHGALPTQIITHFDPYAKLDCVMNDVANCSHRAVYNHLNLVKDNDNSKIRPSRSSSATEVNLDVLLFDILDVIIHNVKFSSIKLCLLSFRIEDNKVPKSPYVALDFDGEVYLRSNMVVVSSCTMEVYKFPFDVQNCNLSFKSTVHPTQDLKLLNWANSKWNLEQSLEEMSQSEWLFVNFSIDEEYVNNFGPNQIKLVYTITMKRRSALYIANFLLPIMFFLGLDLASFGISDSGGEKLGFKVTVLLAVTVMQLILNDILPASSDRIPLIAIYCIGVFGLMMLSLLETILMMYLLGKDAAAKENREDEEQRRNLKKRTSADETPSEQLSVAKEGDSSKPTVESIALENISDELRDVEKTLTRVLNGRKEGNKAGCWTRVAEKVNIVFIITYVIAVIVFLIY